jgi:WhiB family redox-sensing transcriptional regulator
MPAHKGYIRATPHGPDRPDDWREQAECKDDPIPDLWFVPPGDRHGIAAAKAICRRCPVAAECLAEAMANPSIVGVWGGTTENQRAKLRAAMPRQPKDIQHGTPGGHRTHRARGEESCGPCTAAARAQNARDNQRKTAKRRYERAAS